MSIFFKWLSQTRPFFKWLSQTRPDATKDTDNNADQSAQRQGFVSSNGRSDGTALDVTIKCLLDLRSVRDQSADAGLDLVPGGLAHKLTALEKGLIDHLVEQREHQEGLGLLTVSVVGDFNSGKSTFINALLGMDLCPVGDEPTTVSITYFVHGDQERFEQESADGTWVPMEEEKYRALASHKKEGDSEPHTFRISVNSPVLHHIRLVDTPGFDAPPPNANDTRVTEDAVKGSDVLFVLMDAKKGNPSDTLLDQLDRLSQNSTNESRQPVFLLLNKADDLSPSQRREVERVCEKLHGDRFRDVVLVSALQLNEAEDEEPLDALDSAMQRMRSAYKACQPFRENISAELTPQSYRLDVSGNVYDVPVSSNLGLASREQLAEMVKNVAAERHVLLEQQFQRHTLQLREDWQTTLSELDLALKRAIDKSSRGGDSHGEIRRKENALEAIEKAKNDTLSLVKEIFQDLSEEIVVKNERIKKGFWSDTVHYQVHFCLEEADGVVGGHDNWRRIAGIYRKPLKFCDIEFPRTAQQIVESLKKEFLDLIHSKVEDVKQRFGENWTDERKYKIARNGDINGDINDVIDEHKSMFASWGDNINEELPIIQDEIGKMREGVIVITERNQAQVAERAKERAEELRILQERINNMKEHTL